MRRRTGNERQETGTRGSSRSRSLRPRAPTAGLTLVYYGDGKGKTTAALGAVLRTVGQGWRCAVIQFIKGSWPSSEREAIPTYLGKLVTIEAGGKGFVGIVDDRLPKSEHKKQARELFRKVRKMFREWQTESSKQKAVNRERGTARKGTPRRLQPTTNNLQPRLVVLDEILDAVEFGFLTDAEVVQLMKNKPPHLHLILTGHKKFPKILAAADLVTRMKKEKHPFDRGFLAVRGVDF